MSDPRTAQDGIKQGTGVIVVQDIRVACALMACGVPLVSKPTAVIAGEAKRPFFCLNASEPTGLIDVPKVASRVARDPLKFIAEEPMHPVSYALAALMWHASWSAAFDVATPLVALTTKEGGAVVYATLGSRKDKALRKRGFVPVQTPPVSPMEAICDKAAKDAATPAQPTN